MYVPRLLVNIPLSIRLMTLKFTNKNTPHAVRVEGVTIRKAEYLQKIFFS